MEPSAQFSFITWKGVCVQWLLLRCNGESELGLWELISVILMLNIVKCICLLSSSAPVIFYTFTLNSSGVLVISHVDNIQHIDYSHFIMVRRDGKYLMLNQFNNNIIKFIEEMVSISNLSGVCLAELLTFSHFSPSQHCMQVVSIKVNGNFPPD